MTSHGLASPPNLKPALHLTLTTSTPLQHQSQSAYTQLNVSTRPRSPKRRPPRVPRRKSHRSSGCNERYPSSRE
ncbi:hypothetical protein G7K_1226-t1 [Saitoella complicata NRRL Y-17804]|uniref:Uncharacterized protein n=1 Tax=Saitoella complicata (strain BCRC 22490 / CBS 7301 / JCM 7358 / NBRC 10748 / NRRL Y-17804) TaxID=698492 RepID=A0A0E9NAW1_SAICN|nr:hypothetical protein G7K_1226-t1 [Saitoella complicata NRRL Y-17804]